METNIVVDISPPILYLAKFWFLNYGPKCCQPIKLQDSLKCNISKKNWIMKFFWHADKYQSFLHVDNIILDVCNKACPKYPKKEVCIPALSPEKHWGGGGGVGGGVKLVFCLQMNMKVFYKFIVSLWVCIARHVQSTQNNKFTISL